MVGHWSGLLKNQVPHSLRRRKEIAIAQALLASGGGVGSAQDIEAASGGRRYSHRKPVRAIPTAVSTPSRQVEFEQQEKAHAPRHC
jgi:hypothetical protein